MGRREDASSLLSLFCMRLTQKTVLYGFHLGFNELKYYGKEACDMTKDTSAHICFFFKSGGDLIPLWLTEDIGYTVSESEDKLCMSIAVRQNQLWDIYVDIVEALFLGETVTVYLERRCGEKEIGKWGELECFSFRSKMYDFKDLFTNYNAFDMTVANKSLDIQLQRPYAPNAMTLYYRDSTILSDIKHLLREYDIPYYRDYRIDIIPNYSPADPDFEYTLDLMEFQLGINGEKGSPPGACC